MASKYWIKLYHEILDDPKMGKLPDNLWRRFVECCLLAGELHNGGALPHISDIAWRLRCDESLLESEFEQLAELGMLELVDDCTWTVCNFTKRQEAMSGKERIARYRETKKKQHYYDGVTEVKQSSNETVTNRYTDKDKDIDTESDQDRSYAAAVTAYEECFGPISAPIISQQLNDWIDEKGLMLVLDALAKSKKNGARSFAYTEAILRGGEAGSASPVPSLSEVLDPIGTYGRRRYKQMREAVSPEVWAVLEKMGEWTNLCSQSPRDLEFAYKRAIKQ